jgi:hypothetical protein
VLQTIRTALVGISAALRDVVVEILFRDIEYLLDKYMTDMRKVSPCLCVQRMCGGACVQRMCGGALVLPVECVGMSGAGADSGCACV